MYDKFLFNLFSEPSSGSGMSLRDLGPTERTWTWMIHSGHTQGQKPYYVQSWIKVCELSLEFS